ncbi:MAG: hypothetical protein CL908_26135 [Deltaproteobacteria bacterium]|jgi:AcrR family transcriptional regulator|nr:hypothetical protein [Deltaproteobacteria bacterium]
MARPAYSQDQVQAIHEEILASAVAVFRSDGLEALTLRALAGRMGWTPAALYRYFDGKDALIAALRARGFAILREGLRSARSGAADPRDATRRIMRAYLDFAIAEPQLFQLAYQLDQRDSDTYPIVRVERERAFSEALAVGREAVAAGILRGDPLVATHVLWAGCHGLAALAIAGQFDLGCNYDQLIDPLLEQLTVPIETRTVDGHTK